MKIRQLLQTKRMVQAFVLCGTALFGYAHATPTGAPADVLSPGTMLQFALGLGTVLALIVAAGWVMKKSAFGKSAPGLIKVVAGAAVGQRERVVVVEVADVRMILGVAPGRVTALHTIALAPRRLEDSDTEGTTVELTSLQDDKGGVVAESAGAASKLKGWVREHKEAVAADDAGAAALLKAWLQDNKEARGAH